MQRIRFWQVDAFTDRPFGGNSAAICWLQREADSGWMQQVAMEMNLSETAFVRALDDGFELRWFTPTVEVDLCGHATLAAAHALRCGGLVRPDQPIRFHTRSGVLTCTPRGERIEMDFPATPPHAVAAPPQLIAALDVQPQFVGRSKYDYLLVLESPAAVRAVQPDYRLLLEVPTRGVIVTAAGDDGRYDFVSRFFCPSVGINEDPVCGSAHCCLAPYWGERLNKVEMLAFQASHRRGILHLRLHGERVLLSGQSVTVLEGDLLASGS